MVAYADDVMITTEDEKNLKKLTIELTRIGKEMSLNKN